jgi:uncharacterized protein YcfL
MNMLMNKLVIGLMTVGLMAACSSPTEVERMTVRSGSTSDIKITDLRSVERNGLLTAQATIVNKGNSKPVAYRFRWLSKDGAKVAEDEAWKPLTISEGRTEVIEGIAPTPQAKDFRVELNSY